jgi:hypothetical protein
VAKGIVEDALRDVACGLRNLRYAGQAGDPQEKLAVMQTARDQLGWATALLAEASSTLLNGR